MIINRKSRFEKISSKNYPYDDFDEIFKTFAGYLTGHSTFGRSEK